MAPAPLLGFNNNVRHRGRVFHIQTEDSGVRHARIVTHLFADGGRIVGTRRLDYSSYLGQTDMVEALRRLMKDQHKAMFLALRAGELDEEIDRIFSEPGMSTGQSSLVEAAPFLPALASQPADDKMGADGLESLRVEPAQPPSAEASPDSAPANLQAALTHAANAERGTARASSVTQRRDSDAEADPRGISSEGTRRGAVFGNPLGRPSSPSIFNENQGIEASLGDAILSYLADEPERDG
ncbi:MAG: hypothetical protein JW940_10490 [Polyangiaceae bacterium]|nr:hypothetical protein [Polyangiaceae bacterium]